MNFREKGVYIFATQPILILSLTCLLGVINIDSAQYANIAYENNFASLQFFDRGSPYLDKPPFIFWITRLSYLLCNDISSFAYRLPSIFYLILFIFFVYKYISEFIVDIKIETVIYVTCAQFGVLYALADLKTDWYLVVNIAAAIYYLKKCLTYYKNGDYVIFAFWTALALMTKGMIAAVLLSLYFMMHIISLGKRIIHFKWFISLFFIMVFTAPMFYGLYQQFDLNDNFLPNEKQIKSGVWFFIWHQSFGRITGANYFSNNYSPFFYLPYLLIFTFPFTGIIARGIFHIKSIFKEDNREKLYIVTMLAAVFCIFSFSNYKLPHYLLLILPFSTILISMAIAKAGCFKIGIWQVIIVLTTSVFMLLMYEFNAALLCLLILVVWLIIYKILDTNYIVFVFHILFVMGFMNTAIGLQYGHQLFHKIGYKSNIRFYGDGYYDYELLVKRRIPSISLEDIKHQCDR